MIHFTYAIPNYKEYIKHFFFFHGAQKPKTNKIKISNKTDQEKPVHSAINVMQKQWNMPKACQIALLADTSFSYLVTWEDARSGCAGALGQGALLLQEKRILWRKAGFSQPT